MGRRPVKGEPLARALSAHGVTLSAGEAALLAERLLSLIQQGLIVPGRLGPDASENYPAAEESEP